MEHAPFFDLKRRAGARSKNSGALNALDLRYFLFMGFPTQKMSVDRPILQFQ